MRQQVREGRRVGAQPEVVDADADMIEQTVVRSGVREFVVRHEHVQVGPNGAQRQPSTAEQVLEIPLRRERREERRFWIWLGVWLGATGILIIEGVLAVSWLALTAKH
jgi:hypothetical protein